MEDPKKFSGSVQSALLDNLVINKVTFSKQAFVRTFQHLRSDNSDFYHLELYLQGRGLGEIGDRSITMLPNRIHLLDYSNCLKTFSTSDYTEVIGITIPRNLIKTNLLEDRGAISWSMNSAKLNKDLIKAIGYCKKNQSIKYHYLKLLKILASLMSITFPVYLRKNSASVPLSC